MGSVKGRIEFGPVPRLCIVSQGEGRKVPVVRRRWMFRERGGGFKAEACVKVKWGTQEKAQKAEVHRCEQQEVLGMKINDQRDAVVSGKEDLMLIRSVRFGGKS